MKCYACNGEGVWWTECCNGVDGCSCQDLPVFMGTCNVCHGLGEVQEGSDLMANVKTIEGYCFAGSGPSKGFWASRGKRMNMNTKY